MSPNVEKLSDLEIVASALGGADDGFDEIVRRYQKPIANYVFRMLNDYDAALDVVQEVFIKVYNSLGTYRAEYRFSTWLYRIAHNSAIDHIRRRRSNEQSIETEGPDGAYQLQIESSAPSPEDEQVAAEQRVEIDAVIRCLPAAYRELILLRHGHDLSYEEIAEITALPLGTVKNRLFRAREMMRDLLVRRGVVEG